MGFLGIGGSTTGAVVSGVTSFVSDYYENRDFTSAVINGAVSAGISLFWSAVDNIGPKQNQKGYLKYMRKDYHDANRRISNMNLSFAEALPLRRAVNEEKNEKIIGTCIFSSSSASIVFRFCWLANFGCQPLVTDSGRTVPLFHSREFFEKRLQG